MLFVWLEILFECLLDLIILSNFLVNDVEDIFQDKIHLSNGGSLDEVLDNFDLEFAHIYKSDVK